MISFVAASMILIINVILYCNNNQFPSLKKPFEKNTNANKHVERPKRHLIPVFGFGSTRRGNGTGAGEESAKLAALL